MLGNATSSRMLGKATSSSTAAAAAMNIICFTLKSTVRINECTVLL